MKASRICVALCILALLGCRPHADVQLTSVTIEQAGGFIVEGRPAATTEELIAQLKALPNLEAIHLKPAAGVSQEKITATVRTIQEAGIKVPIGMVGNDIYTK